MARSCSPPSAWRTLRKAWNGELRTFGRAWAIGGLTSSAFVLLGPGCVTTIPSWTPCSEDQDCELALGSGSRCLSSGFCESFPCDTDAQCRDVLGFGSSCQPDSGLCRLIEPISRCSDTVPDDLFTAREQYKDYIVFGSLFDLSANIEQARVNGVATAAAVIDQTGVLTLNDIPRGFGVINCDIATDAPAKNAYGDELTSAEASVATAQWLTETMKVPGIIGAPTSSKTLRVFAEVVAPIAPQTVMISPTAAGATLFGADVVEPTDQMPGLLWRTTAKNTDIAPVAVEYMMRAGDDSFFFPEPINRIGLLHDLGPQGESIAGDLQDLWPNGQIDFFEFVEQDADSLEVQTDKLVQQAMSPPEGQQPVDAIVFAGNSFDRTTLMRILAENTDFEQSLDLPVVFLGTGAIVSTFDDAKAARSGGPCDADFSIPNCHKPFDYVFALSIYVDELAAVYRTFQANYMELFEGESPTDYEAVDRAYDAYFMLALGSVWALYNEPELSGRTIARGFRHMVPRDQTTTQPVRLEQNGWSVAVQQFRMGRSIDITGASGDLEYDLSTEERPTRLEWVQANPEGTTFQHLDVVEITEPAEHGE